MWISFLFITAICIIISLAQEECFRDTKGAQYHGKTNVTSSGKPCQMWGSQTPHRHTFAWLYDQKNYCRNPDGESRPWCYTTENDTRWELCNVTKCEGIFNPCGSSPCLNGGICSKIILDIGQGIFDFLCNCPSEWNGKRCQEMVPWKSCDSQPCQNGGTCLAKKYSFNCLCPMGFVGPACQVNATPEKCENGWTFDGIGCYKLHIAPLTKDDALNMCHFYDGNLVDGSLMAVMTSVYRIASEKGIQLWTGMECKNKALVTDQGKMIANTSFLMTACSINTSCIAIHGLGRPNNNWYKDSCDSLKPFVCYRDQGRCPDGYYHHSNKCYLYKTHVLASFSDTKELCTTNGDTIFQPKTMKEQIFATSLVRRMMEARGDGRIWLGLKLNDMGNWVWLSDETEVYYGNWLNNSGSGQSECVYSDTESDGKWSRDISCRYPLGVLCVVDISFVKGRLQSDSGFNNSSFSNSSQCGQGWVNGYSGDYCYKYVSTLQTWTESQQTCWRDNAELLSISNKEEQSFIHGWLKTYNSNILSRSIWTGGNCRYENRGWRWSDSSPFSFINWLPGNPSDFTGTQECISMSLQYMMWEDNSCSQLHSSLCKRKNPAVPATVIPTIEVLNSSFGCPKGWQERLSFCYNVQTQNVTKKEAERLCLADGASLISITSEVENIFLSSMILPFVGEHTSIQFWIGLEYNVNQGSFTWTDGSPLVITDWKINEPGLKTHDDAWCVSAYVDPFSLKRVVGMWNPVQCDLVLSGFICKKKKEFLITTPLSPFKVGCSQTAVGHGVYCYDFSGNTSSWIDAQSVCRLKGGNLATVNTRSVQSFLASELQGKADTFWIGYTYLNGSTAIWSSGAAIEFTYIESRATGNNECVVMSGLKPIGLWHYRDCSSSNKYICEYPRIGFTTTPSPTIPTPAPRCSITWIQREGFCYKGFDQKLPWTEARRACRELGADLVSIHNPDDMKFLFNKFFALDTPWIGLSDRNSEGVFEWTDGTPLDYGQWARNQPDNWYNNEDCIILIKRGHRYLMNDIHCSDFRKFICKVKIGKELNNTFSSMAIEKCADKNWYHYNGNCYMVINGAKEFNYFGAKKECNKKGSHLMSIHDMEETNFIIRISLQESVKSNLWIGLTELNDEYKFKWDDGSILNFQNWARNEPNDYGGEERCVHFVPSRTGVWADHPCGYKLRSFVCKKGNETDDTPLSTTAVPLISGGCLPGFIPSPLNNKCYLVSNNSAQTLTWSDANRKCSSYGPGFYLLSVHSGNEMRFVTSLLNGKYFGRWIGLKRQRVFIWIDNSELTYANWAPGQPSRLNCGILWTVRKSGQWLTTSCSSRNGYICQGPKDTKINQKKENSCPSNYYEFANRCYKFTMLALNWMSASTNCQTDGGRLSSITNIFEYSFVRTLSTTHSVGAFWIGLRSTNDTTAFAWSDRLPYTFTSWFSPDEPSMKPGEECVLSSNGSWHDVSCNLTLPSLCEIDRDPINIEPRQIDCEASSLGFSSSLVLGNACFYLVKEIQLDWFNASSACQLRGTSLASLISANEVEHVHEYLRKVDNLSGSYWIGLTKQPLPSSSFGWRWEDGSPFEYKHWTLNSPSYSFLRYKLCAEMMFTGHWNDMFCLKRLKFICKRPMGIESTSQSQTTADLSSSVTATVSITTDENMLYPKPLSEKTSGASFQVAGIVGILMTILVIVLIFIIGFYVRKRRRPGSHSIPSNSGFENALYSRSSVDTFDNVCHK